MIIQLNKDISDKDRNGIIDRVNALKYKTTKVNTQKGAYIIGTGKKAFDIRDIGFMEGIADIHIVSMIISWCPKNGRYILQPLI